jgi:hypothetical protein
LSDRFLAHDATDPESLLPAVAIALAVQRRATGKRR